MDETEIEALFLEGLEADETVWEQVFRELRQRDEAPVREPVREPEQQQRPQHFAV